jgi:hypothetical protein
MSGLFAPEYVTSSTEATVSSQTDFTAAGFRE